jgi:hypothetical protein
MKKAKVSKYGQWKYPGQDTIIPNANGSITMKGVPYPVLGIDDRGNRKLMMPGGEYQFPGNSVYEIPMMAAGGIVNPCPPGKVPDGKGNCVDDLTTPPIPSSSLYPYYTEQLAKAKANPKITNPDALVGQMIRCKRDGSCKIGEEWKEEEKITKVPPEPGPKQHYTLVDSGNPGQGYVWKYTDDGNGGYNQELIGSAFVRDFLNDQQQSDFYNKNSSGVVNVDYDPNVHKIYRDQHDINKVIQDERGWEQNAQNNINREQQRIEQENAAREQWEQQQREKQNKRIAPPKDVAIPPGGFAMGGELDHGKVAGRSRTKANNKNYVLNQTFYEDGFIDNNSRRTLKGFITGAPKPGEPGAPAKLAMGGAKKVKIKSLPKAQDLGELTPEQRKVYDNRYIYNREHGFDSNESNRSALQDAQYSNTGPIYNFQPFLPNPDSGVRVPSGKRFPLEHMDWSTYDPWGDMMRDPEYVKRYNDPKNANIQGRMKSFFDNMNAETYYKNLDNVKAWERDWYSKRAQLPQFTDVANKRLNLINSVNMQPFADEGEFNEFAPDAAAAFFTDGNYIGIPGTGFSQPSNYVHERSHWFDWNAPQNDDMYNGSYFRSYLKPGSIPNPVYNDEDEILTNIIPSEYKFPSGVVDPLRLGENDTTTYDTETEKIEANMPKSSDSVNGSSIRIPFKGDEKIGDDSDINYYYKPTEVRARLNEWRFEHNIDPTKNYTNEELQDIINSDIKSGKDNNFDFYKIIRGRGDLLKQINDSYVSTGDKENPDEMPKAQRGLRKDKNKNKVKKGKTLFGRPYQIVETEAGPDLWGNERPGETTRVKTVYYKNGNIAKQKIDNNENGGDEVTWHDKNGVVTAERNGDGYRTFSNGYFQSINNVDFENVKRIHDEIDRINPKNKLQGFVQRAKLNLENMSREGSQPGDSYNTVWPDWENDRFNYTRKKNPDVRKSRAKFQGGGLPNDYQDFLGYSETAPENRRPDSEWQYGNPRQYDHYGMWDALGKPENFNQALEKNPQWQPDPYDNMYHGFSTNPNTGVWLKSHIPGESHPGDTGWMEYKDFMLSNDRNWGGKNQNLVYDPDLQRMRYVDRKKAGGTIKQVRIKSLPKAQTEGQFTPGFQTSYDVSKSMAENLELNRRANVMGWKSVADYEKSNWGQNDLVLKQRALVNNPQVQKIAQTAAEMNPELANVQTRQDQVYADRRDAGDKTVGQIYNALSNPVEAAGHALKYGYVPQGNVGNYGQRQDGDAFSDVTQMLNPFAWGNAAYRLSHDLTNKDSWTTGAGGLNMGLDFLESVPLLGEIAAGARPTLQAIARSPLVSGFHDLAASPRSYGPTYLQTLKNTGENILTRTGEVKNIIRPPKLSTNDASLYDAGKSEKMLKYIFDPKFRKGSGEWDIKFWDWFHSPNEGEVLQRIANKLDYPVNLSSLGDMKGGFGTVVPTTHDASKLVKFGTLSPWEVEAPGIFSKLDEIGKLNTDPYIGLPVKSHIFPNLKLDIAFNKGDGSLVQVLNKVPGVPLRKFATTSPENLQFLKNSLTDETIQSARNRLSFLQKNNLGVDWQNPDNFLFDPTTGEMGIVDIAAMPRKVTGPEGGGIRWFNSLGSDYGDIYEKAMGAVMGDPTRAAMKIRPVIDQVKPVMERMPNYSYILERQGYPSIWKKNPQSKPVWESAFEAQTALPGLRTLFSNLQKAKTQVPGLGSIQTPTPPPIPRITGFNKREGGMTSTKGKKKQPGFQVLTDANGKYVFVKT